MTQAPNFGVPRSGPVAPDVMAGRIDDNFDAQISSHSGASRPAYAVAGTLWLSTATAGKHKYYFFDGTNDHLVVTIDTATGAVIYSNGTVDNALATKAPKSVYATKTGNYTAVAADAGATHRYTAAATVSLTAAATLGNGWPYTIVANGAAVTIDPNGSETINGLTTIIVPDGCTAEVICDGSNFFMVIKPTMWVPVGQGLYTVSAASQLVITDLSAYRKLRISGQLSNSAASGLSLTVSTNNGSSFDTASNYFQQTLVATTTSVVANATATSAMPLAGGAIDASSTYSFSTELENFNQNTVCLGLTRDCGVTASNRTNRNSSVSHSGTSARNALRIFPSSGNYTGAIMVEGVIG